MPTGIRVCAAAGHSLGTEPGSGTEMSLSPNPLLKAHPPPQKSGVFLTPVAARRKNIPGILKDLSRLSLWNLHSAQGLLKAKNYILPS